MDFTCNYFELFGLPAKYKVDLALLATRYHELQCKFHPDRHMSGTPYEQRLAVQYVSFINQAYTELESSLARAKYLLFLKKIEFSDETHIVSDPIVLMEQIELREKLSDIHKSDEGLLALNALREEASLGYTEIQEIFEQQYNQNEFQAAFASLEKMQFMNKFLNEIERFEEKFDDLKLN